MDLGLLTEKLVGEHEAVKKFFKVEDNFLAIKQLVSSDPSVLDLTTKHGRTLLHWACRVDDLKMTEMLLDAGADIEAKTENDNTPLHVACRYQSIEVAKFLIERDANLLAMCNYHGCRHTPLESALSINEEKLQEFIKERDIRRLISRSLNNFVEKNVYAPFKRCNVFVVGPEGDGKTALLASLRQCQTPGKEFEYALGVLVRSHVESRSLISISPHFSGPAAAIAESSLAPADPAINSKLNYDEDLIEGILLEMKSGKDVGCELKLSVEEFEGHPDFSRIFFSGRPTVFIIVFDLEQLCGPSTQESCLKLISDLFNNIVDRSRSTPTIALVGTIEDEIFSPERLCSISDVLKDHFRDTIGWQNILKNQDLNFFTVDCHLGWQDVDIANFVMSLDRRLLSCPLSCPLPCRLSWLKFLDTVKKMDEIIVPLHELRDIAATFGIHEDSFERMLSFIHETGNCVWINEEGLRDWVVLNLFKLLQAPTEFKRIYGENWITSVIKNIDMFAQRDCAIAKKDSAIIERDSAVMTVTAQRDTAVRERDTERDTAVRERDTERDTAVRERDTVMAERDAAVRERDTVTAERDTAVRERDTVMAERDTAVRERDTVMAERDTAVRERDTVMAERDTAERERRAQELDLRDGRRVQDCDDAFVRYRPYVHRPLPLPPGYSRVLLPLPNDSALYRLAEGLFRTRGSSESRPVAGFSLVRVEAVVSTQAKIDAFIEHMSNMRRVRETAPGYNADTALFSVPQMRVLNAVREEYHERSLERNRLEARTLYVFHGPPVDAVDGICENGLQAARAQDAGYFGAGSYSSLSVEYAARYAAGELENPRGQRDFTATGGLVPVIMFAAAVNMAYPVTDVDYPDPPRADGHSTFFGQPLRAGFDSHVACVREGAGFEAVQKENCEYVELVVANYQQLLPLAVFWLRPI